MPEQPKKETFAHIIYIPFRGVGIDLRDEAWFRERIEIFKNYTFKSLKNQTENKFVLWFSFRPEDYKTEPLDDLYYFLMKNNVLFVFTFNGLMYYDDKYAPEWISRIKNLGRIVRRCWRSRQWDELPSAFYQILQDKNSTLELRIQHALDVLKVHMIPSDWVYMTRLDSDDMLHKDALKEIQAIEPFEGAITMQNGFIYNSDTKQLAEYHPKKNPPFHTIVFKSDTFYDAAKHVAYYKGFRSHEDIPNVFQSEPINEGRYCVLTHNPKNHISTIWNHPFRGEVITENVDKILADFGIL